MVCATPGSVYEFVCACVCVWRRCLVLGAPKLEDLDLEDREVLVVGEGRVAHRGEAGSHVHIRIAAQVAVVHHACQPGGKERARVRERKSKSWSRSASGRERPYKDQALRPRRSRRSWGRCCPRTSARSWGCGTPHWPTPDNRGLERGGVSGGG